MHSVLTEKTKDLQRRQKTYREDGMKKKRMKKDEALKTEWVLCSEDWRDIVITHVPQINDIAIENN